MTQQLHVTKTFKSEYQAFHDAKNRCTNPKHPRYKDWGGRGIQFRFQSFHDFINEIGPKPEGFSIDRIDNDGHYESGNVRWSSRVKQQHNRRKLSRNKTGTTGVRVVQSPGLITPTYQAHININGVWHQLYSGPDFEKAIEARKRKEQELHEIS